MSALRVAVVGAGLGGLAAAVRLSALGNSVDVYDRQSFPGGKAGEEKLGSFRFDTGPSLLTMPTVLEGLFVQAGESMSRFLRLVRLQEITRYFFDDGTRMSSFSDSSRFASEIGAKTSDEGEQLHRYLRYSKRIYDTSAHLFLDNSLYEASTYTSYRALKSILSFPRIDPFRSMHTANESYFHDPRMVQLFDRYATYNGSSPYAVPATLNIIPHVEYTLGCRAVDGGIYQIPTALSGLAKRLGTALHLGVGVDRILYDRSRRVRGIMVDGRERIYDAVVSNADVVSTYERLLGDPDAPAVKRYRALEPSSSGLVFYLGMQESFPELGLHNIFFSGDYRREFHDIFVDGRCPADPTVYVNITSKVNREDAADGGENWFVLVNAPAAKGQDWGAELRRVREALFARIERSLGRPVRHAVGVEAVMSPADIEARTGSRFGSLYGISSNSRMAAFLRHPNRSRRYRGLYFCGGGAHPGGGMPLVLKSGIIAAELLRRHEE